MYILWICVAIFVVVFGAMFYLDLQIPEIAGRKARREFSRKHADRDHLTVIPFIILIAIAIPAAKTVLDMKDASHPEVTVKATAFQWGWRYDYSADDVGFYSYLKTPWSQIGQPGTKATEDAKNPTTCWKSTTKWSCR